MRCKKGLGVSFCFTSSSIRFWATMTGSLAPVLSTIAAKHGTISTAVLLSWAIGQNFVLIVTIVSTVMTEEYLQAFAIKLTPEEQEEIAQARRGHR